MLEVHQSFVDGLLIFEKCI